MAARIIQLTCQIRTWVKMFSGKSYWHVPCPLGRAFVPGKLEGYYCDLTRKIPYPGPVDADGIPYLNLVGRENYYSATLLLHLALAYWDVWLLSGKSDEKAFSEFLRYVRKVASTADASMGWPIAWESGQNTKSPYSAMTQGEAASAFVRAWKSTGETRFLDAARKALELMLKPISENGCARMVGNSLLLEEFSYEPQRTILNGWIFGVFGLYDFNLATGELGPELVTATEGLCEWLPRFDAGFWSYYDTAGEYASPYYHDLHISQLAAMAAAFPAHKEIEQIRRRFMSQSRNYIGRGRAIAIKGIQRVRARHGVVMKS